CPIYGVLFFLGVVKIVGQGVDPNFDPHRFGRKSKKNPRNRMISGIFWSCWADSNRRPHPYQRRFDIFSNLFRSFLVFFS
ncbi:hypothetical protein, partial [Flintibacter sp.]|uniref:hypothetical protein n=1 Tax=Flintibacter sp. TaxID=1918624 RepID=UPI003A48AD0E